MLHLCGNVRYKIILHQQRSMVMILHVMQRETIVLFTRVHDHYVHIASNIIIYSRYYICSDLGSVLNNWSFILWCRNCLPFRSTWVHPIFSKGSCIVCPPSYGFWLPLCYV